MRKSIKRVTIVLVLFTCGVLHYQDKQAKGLSILAIQNNKEQQEEGIEEEIDQDANQRTWEEQQANSNTGVNTGVDNNYNIKTEDGFFANNSNDVVTSSAAASGIGSRSNAEPISLTSGSSNDLAMNGADGIDTKAGGPNNGEGNSDYKSFDNSTTTQAVTSNGISSSVVSAGATATATATTAAGASVRAPSTNVVTAPPSNPGGGGTAADPYAVPIDDYYGLIFLIVTSTIIGVYSLKKSRVV